MPPPFLIWYFTNYTVAETIDLARNVKTLWTNHPHPLLREPPDHLMSLDKFGEKIDRTQTALDESANHDSEKIKIRIFEHKGLKHELTRYAMHSELIGNGDVAFLKTTGFPFRNNAAKKRSSTSPLPAPEPTAKHGEQSGTIIVKAKKVPGAKSYHLQFTQNPSDDGSWADAGDGIYTSVVGILIGGLIPGVNYSFRICAIGPNGHGPWSPPFTLRSL